MLPNNPLLALKVKAGDDPEPSKKVERSEARHSTPSAFVDSLIQQESGGDPNAVSPVGAVGLAQSMPHTARDPGYGVRPLKNPRDPDEARRFADEYMGAMLSEFEDPGHSLMGYNWGVGNTKRWIENGSDPSKVPQETIDYVKDLGPVAVRTTGNPISTSFFSKEPKPTEEEKRDRRARDRIAREGSVRNVAPADGTGTASSKVGVASGNPLLQYTLTSN